jgi:hypothetical protein
VQVSAPAAKFSWAAAGALSEYKQHHQPSSFLYYQDFPDQELILYPANFWISLFIGLSQEISNSSTFHSKDSPVD